MLRLQGPTARPPACPAQPTNPRCYCCTRTAILTQPLHNRPAPLFSWTRHELLNHPTPFFPTLPPASPPAAVSRLGGGGGVSRRIGRGRHRLRCTSTAGRPAARAAATTPYTHMHARRARTLGPLVPCSKHYGGAAGGFAPPPSSPFPASRPPFRVSSDLSFSPLLGALGAAPHLPAAPAASSRLLPPVPPCGHTCARPTQYRLCTLHPSSRMNPGPLLPLFSGPYPLSCNLSSQH